VSTGVFGLQLEGYPVGKGACRVFTREVGLFDEIQPGIVGVF